MSIIYKTKLSLLLLIFLLGSFLVIPLTAQAQAPLSEGLREVASDEPETFIYPAQLQIPLPGFSLKDSIVEGDGSNGCGIGDVCVHTINYYINAFYRYSAAAAFTFAVVLIMIGGAQYIVGSSMGTIDAAKKRMWNAVIGLVLVLSTHSILSFVNPAITSFKPLGLETIPNETSFSIETRKGGAPIFLERLDGKLRDFYDCEDDEGLVTPCQFNDGKESAIPMRDALAQNGRHAVHESIIKDVQGVAGGMYYNPENKNKKLYLIRGYRGYELEGAKFFANCADGGDCAYCDPWGGEPEISPWTKDGDKYKLKEVYQEQYDEAGGANGGGRAALRKIFLELGPQITKQTCPYLTGLTLDIVCAESNGNYKKGRLVSGKCQKELEVKMKAHGFCRSYAEPWHFEHKTGAISESAVACDWVPGTIFIDSVKNDISDQEDCDKSDKMTVPMDRGFRTVDNPFISMGKFNGSDTGCIANYGLSASPFSVTDRKFLGF
jgi:hypothetical protein